jgi:hypothetical protein
MAHAGCIYGFIGSKSHAKGQSATSRRNCGPENATLSFERVEGSKIA